MTVFDAHTLGSTFGFPPAGSSGRFRPITALLRVLADSVKNSAYVSGSLSFSYFFEPQFSALSVSEPRCILQEIRAFRTGNVSFNNDE
jgi:hypothetical protein